MKLVAKYPLSLVCQVLNCPRSSYYYRPKGREEQALRAGVEQGAATWPTYGYRRITVQLRREGFKVNGKGVRRIMAELGLKGKVYRGKKRTTNSDHPFPRYPNLVQELEVARPDQVWVADITYIKLLVYSGLEPGTKSKPGANPSSPRESTGPGCARDAPLRPGGAVRSHRLCPGAGVQISMAAVGKAWQNGYAERMMRTIKEEEVELSEYQDYWDAYWQIRRFLEDVYLRKRIHSSLGYLTPVEFESQGLAQQGMLEVVH
jgi:putative transposase